MEKQEARERAILCRFSSGEMRWERAPFPFEPTFDILEECESGAFEAFGADLGPDDIERSTRIIQFELVEVGGGRGVLKCYEYHETKGDQ